MDEKKKTTKKQSPVEAEEEGDRMGCHWVSNVTHNQVWSTCGGPAAGDGVLQWKAKTPNENEEHKWWFDNSVAPCGHHPTQPHPRSLLQPFQLMCAYSGDFNNKCD